MARFTAMINQFNGGYMSQRMNARTNMESWPTYLKDSCNFLPTVWGGNKFRAGTKYVFTSEKSHLIPFIFNNSIAYVVEFLDNKCRFYRNGKPVLNDDEEVLEIYSPYSYDSITGANGECLIKKQQSGDVMYLATGKHPLYKLIRSAENVFIFQILDFKKGPYSDKVFIKNFEYTIEKSDEKNCLLSWVGEVASTNELSYSSITSGAVGTAVYVSLRIGENWVFEDTVLVSYGAQVSLYEAVYNFFNANDYGFYLQKGTAAPSFTAYSREGKANELAGKRIIIYLTWRTISGSNRFMKWDGYFGEPGASLSPFTDSYNGKNIRLSFSKIEISSWVAGESYESNAIVESDGKYYLNLSVGTAGTKKPVHTEGIFSDGKLNWKFLNYGYVDGEIVEVQNEKVIKIFFEDGVDLLSQYIDWYQLSLFSTGTQEVFPTSVFFFKERLGISLVGGKVPQIAFSQTGDYENFDPLVGGEVTDESAILSDLVVGEVDVVNWCVGLDDVLVATESNFLLVSPATTAENFSPTNIKIDYLSSNGAGKIAPVVYGDSVIYVDEKNSSLFTNGYYWESDGYKTAKISWAAEDLLENGLKAICYQKDPDSVLWSVTKEGDLVSLTYESSQNVTAYALHATDGEVESICCIPSSDGKKEEVWLNVKRTLPDGSIKYCIEVMQSNTYDNLLWAKTRREVSNENYKLAKEYLKKTFWHVDSGIEKQNEETFTEVDGLEHLEGKSVCAIADGEHIKDLIVEEGKVRLGKPCNYAIVGLPYEGYFVPNTINAGSQNGASQGKTQRIHAVTIRLFRSRDFKCGDGVRMKEVIVSKNGVAGEGVITGDIRIAFPGTYSNRYSEDSSAEIVIKQDKPYPLCVNGLILEMETYDA